MSNNHKIICFLNLWRVFLIYCIVISLKSKNRFFQDLQAWKLRKELPFTSHFMVFLYLMLYKEFRNIVYKRMGNWSYCVKWFCPQFSSLITAQKIGNNAKIFQQVTIEYKGDKLPVIGNNMEFCCGAKY